MKKLLLLSLSALTLISCSQQKFAFRKKVKTNQEVAQLNDKMDLKGDSEKSTLYIEKQPNLIQSNPTSNSTLPSEEVTPNIEIETTEVKKSNDVVQIPTELEEVKSAPVDPTNPERPASATGGNASKNWGAVAGIILSIAGYFFAGLIFCSLGIVFSAIGLKSEKKGLAVAGIVLGIVGLILTIFVISEM